MLSVVNRSKYGRNTSSCTVKNDEGTTWNPGNRTPSKFFHVAVAPNADSSSPASCSRRRSSTKVVCVSKAANSMLLSSSPKKSPTKRPGTPNTILSTPVTSHDGDCSSQFSSFSASSSLQSEDEVPLVWPVPLKAGLSEPTVLSYADNDYNFQGADHIFEMSHPLQLIDNSNASATIGSVPGIPDEEVVYNSRCRKWPWKKRQGSAPAVTKTDSSQPTPSNISRHSPQSPLAPQPLPHPASPFSSFRRNSPTQQPRPCSSTLRNTSPNNPSTINNDHKAENTIENLACDSTSVHDSIPCTSSRSSNSTSSSDLPAIVSPAYRFLPIGHDDSDDEGDTDSEEEDDRDNLLLCDDTNATYLELQPQQVQHRAVRIVDTNEIDNENVHHPLPQRQEQPGCCVQEEWGFFDLPLLLSKCACDWAQMNDTPKHDATAE